MVKKILEEIKNQEIKISEWILGSIGIVFIRFILESISSPGAAGGSVPSGITMVHWGLYYAALTLGIIIIVGYFSRNYVLVSKIALFGLPIIWLAPILDLLISGGKGLPMTYIFDTGRALLFDFVTFFGPSLNTGATYGLRTGIAVVLMCVFWYIWRESRSILRSVVGTLSVYTFGFILAALPSLVYIFSHVHSVGSPLEISHYLWKLIFGSTITHNTLFGGVPALSFSDFYIVGFDKIFSQILFILACFLGALLWWKIDPRKFLVIFRNSRAERIGSYIALLLSGAGFAYIQGLGTPFVWIDILGFMCLLIAQFALWMYAVHVNDITDVEIDKISNPDRPLIKGGLHVDELRETGYIWFIVAPLGSWCAGFFAFFMSIVYIASSYIYSSPPLRLRRFPLIPSFLIGVAGLATVLTGFFFVSSNKDMHTFPTLLAMGIIVMITLAINVKDMKDIKGDAANGIMTLPVLFKQNGPRIVAACFALSLLLVPIFLSFYYLYIFAIPCAFIGYILVTRKPYREAPLFILKFTFISCVALSYIATYYLK